MGLDMYAFTTTQKPEQPVDFEAQNRCELHYWRKHPDLHGWMENLYREKGGEEETFNVVNLELNEDDLNRLEADIKAQNLPHTEGFFFGESIPGILKDDLDFIKNARKAIADGKTVFYTSWW